MRALPFYIFILSPPHAGFAILHLLYHQIPFQSYKFIFFIFEGNVLLVLFAVRISRNIIKSTRYTGLSSLLKNPWQSHFFPFVFICYGNHWVTTSIHCDCFFLLPYSTSFNLFLFAHRFSLKPYFPFIFFLLVCCTPPASKLMFLDLFLFLFSVSHWNPPQTSL